MAQAQESINLFEINVNVDAAIEDTKRLKEEIVKLEAATKQAKDEIGDTSDEYIKYSAELRNAKAELREQEKMNVKIIQSRNEEIGTIKRLEAQNSALRAEQKKLNLDTEEGIERNKQIVAQINANTEAIKANSDEQKKGFASVGQYANGIKDAAKSLGELKKELTELKKVSFSGKSEEEIQALKTRIGELTDEMGDLKAEMAELGGPGIASIITGLKLIAASVEGVVGTLSVFGVESEVIQKLESKITSLIAVTQALSEIEEVVSTGKLRAIGIKLKAMVIDAKDTVQKWANVVATNAQNKAEEAKLVLQGKASIATKALAAVQWLWNAALAANPVMLIVTGIAALTAGIYALTKAMGDNTDEVEKQKAAYNDLIELNKKTQADAEYQLELAKASGESDIELYKIQRDNYKKRLNDIDAEIDALNKIKDVDSEATAERIKKNKELSDEWTKTNNALYLFSLEYEKKQKELAEKASADKKKIIEDDAKKRQDQLKKDADDFQKQFEAESQAALKKMQDEQKAIAEMQRQQNEDAEYWAKEAEKREQRKIESRLRGIEKQKEIDAINFQNQYDAAQADIIMAMDFERQKLEQQRKLEVEYAEKIGADVGLINEKYSNYYKQITQDEINYKLDATANFANNLAQLFGQNTKIGRIAAATAATIDAYRGAMAAFAQTPGGIVIKSAAAVAAGAVGVMNVRKILSTKSGLPGDGGGGSAPSISTPTVNQSQSLTPEIGQGIIGRSSLLNQDMKQALQPTLVVDNVTQAQNKQSEINQTSTI